MTAVLLPLATAGLSPATVRGAVQDEIAHSLSVPRADVEVAHLGLAFDLACPEDATVRVVVPHREPFPERVDLTVVGEHQGRECARARLQARVKVWQAVSVAARPTAAGALIEVAQGRVLRSEVNGVPVDPNAGPFVARSALAPGEPLTLDRVRTPPDERSGGLVTLVAGRGAVSLEAKGRLLRDARVGDTVEVINSATGVLVRGVLVEPGRVQAGRTQ